jgi:diguanylate cyclase (GGDEF)-like protein/PAS domain S-box-containing protein
VHKGSGMLSRRRILLTVAAFALLLAAIYIAIWGFYHIALGDAREHMTRIAQARAEFAETIGLESVAQYGMGETATAATLSRIEKARTESRGLGQTGEFNIAYGDGDQIVFLFVHRSFDHDIPPSVPMDSDLAVAMQQALGSASGILIGADYSGKRVLAAYEPIPVFGWGLVAQIDLAEVGAPYRHAAWNSTLILILMFLVGMYVSSKAARPVLRRIGETEQRYQELIETMGDGLAIQGKDERLIYVNNRYCEILGRDRQELIGHATDEYMTEESREFFHQLMTQRREGVADSYEVTFIRPDGNHVHVRSAPRPTFGPKGEYEGSFAVHSDISAQRHAEIDLRNEKERAQRYLDIAGVILVVLNKHGQIDLINREGLSILGYEDDAELLGKDWVSACVPESRQEQVRNFFGQLTAGDVAPSSINENLVLTKDGKERVVSWRNRALQDSRGVIVGTLSSGMDVTERRETELRSQLAAEVSSDLIYEWDIHSDELQWFGDIDSALGYKPGEIPRTIGAWIDLIHPDDVKLLERSVQLHRTSTKPIQEEYRVSHRDGTWRHWIDRGAPVLDDKGLPCKWIGACIDVSEQVRVEKALQEKEAQYRSIFESTTDTILIINMAGTVVAANPLAFEMYGYSEEELIGISSAAIIHPDYFHGFKNFRRRVAEGKPFNVDSVNLRKDGTAIDIEMHGAGFTYRGEPHLLSVVRDITERKQAEKALQQARQKIEQLHEIAHRMGTCESEDEIYRITVETAEKILSFSTWHLGIIEGDKLVTKATSLGTPPEFSRDRDLNDGVAGKTYRTQETIVFGGLDEVPEATPTQGNVIVSGISAPIGDFGVFQVTSSEANTFEEEDVRLIELLLGHTAEAVSRIRLREKLREQAFRDPLTGAYNRRYFNQVVEQEIPRSKRYDHPLGFLMIDVDHFKEINDRYGHQKGDEVLHEVANLLQEQVRGSDVVVRFGGDEFLVLLVETNGETEEVKQRILEEIASRNKTNPVFDFAVTFSIGAAHWSPDDSQSVKEVLAEADKRMYEAKRKLNGTI